MNENILKHYILGVSLGLMREPTALAIIKQEVRVRDGWAPYNHALTVKDLERIPLDMSHPDMVDRVAKRMAELEKLEQANEPDLIVDITGAGLSGGRMFENSGLNPIVVTITGGNGETETEQQTWNLSRNEFGSALGITLSSRRVNIAKFLDLGPTLQKEMLEFQPRAQTVNYDDPESWREGQYDDLVFAVGLPVWWANKNIPSPPVEEWTAYQQASPHGWLG